MEEITSNCSALFQHLLRVTLNYLCGRWLIEQTESLHPPAPRAPHLMVRRIINNRASCQLISLSEKTMQETPVLPLSFSLPCTIPSSCGWLLLQDPDDNRFKFLFNSLTSTRIELPEAEEFVHYHDCLFFSTPADPDGVLLVAKSNSKFLLCRLSHQSGPTFHPLEWKRSAAFVSNVIFCQGKLYALEGDGSLTVVDALFPNSEVKMELMLRNTRPPQVHCYRASFLVDSCGEVLLVRVLAFQSSLTFDVFRADLTKLEWVKMENLGDRAVFLSRRSSVSLCASEYGYKANHIYYVPTLTEWNVDLYKESNGMRGTHIEFEVGREGSSIPSIPASDGLLIGCDWLT